ncbi:uncharacterized protein LAESUDRAFT_808755 [Laetiporus sulphureus 93-53]|uniref:Geranylgeranyl pyrophosphate synthetase n=1 Tax=Laetiporus sulphureus 93-53 TaxID=1314785 RepID=A0A165HIJ8_9APHY|nr:uncharacterized protein LAESUDRAFT_808755 [Laetiporus sulphureus 93-53]KZT11773.1 hypothetical protein LAESUDRAFT_808755 [Laetiporus sulphureus 93-53]
MNYAVQSQPRRPRHNEGIRNFTDGLSSMPVASLSRPVEVEGLNIAIEHCEYVGSYNWLDLKTPSILVPGSPRMWRDKALPFEIPPDQGRLLVYEDGFRMPAYPRLPMLKAVDVMTEATGRHLRWPDIDFITDRNFLRKLLLWAGGGGSGRNDAFRIDLQLFGERTVLLNRYDERTWLNINPKQGSYGRNFEEHTTTAAPGCERGGSHNRVVQYKFGGLSMLVVFEVDAYLSPENEASSSNAPPSSSEIPVQNPTAPSKSPQERRQRSSQEQSELSEPTLNIIRAGTEVPQSSLIELKTSIRPLSKKWNNAYPQLLFSQTPHIFFAEHKNGKFTSMARHQLGAPDMQEIDRGAEPRLKKLRSLLRDIQELAVRGGKTGRLTLLQRNGKMEVYERTSDASFLPESISQRFDPL